MNKDKEIERHGQVLEKIKNAKTREELPNVKISNITRYITSNSSFDGKAVSQTFFKPVVEAILDYGNFSNPEVKKVYMDVLSEHYSEKTREELEEKYMEVLNNSYVINDYIIEISERTKRIEEFQEKEDLEEHKGILKQIKDAYEIKDLPKVGRGTLNKRIHDDTKNDFVPKIAISKLQELSEDLYTNGVNEKTEDIILKICDSEELTDDDKKDMFDQIFSGIISDKKIGYLVEEIKEKENRILQIYKFNHEETMENIKNAKRISQLPNNLTFSTLASYFSGNTTIYTNGEKITTTDFKDITQLILDGKDFESEEVKYELMKLSQKYYPDNSKESYELLYSKLKDLPKTKYYSEEINYSQERQQEFIGRSCSNVNVYFIPNPKSPIEGGKFYNCYINRVENLNLDQILPLDLDAIVPKDMDVDSVEWYVQEYHDPTFKAAGGIILNKDETIGNVNIFKPSDGKIGITPEEKNKYDEIEELGKQVKDLIKNKKEKMEKFKEMQKLYFQYQQETDEQLCVLESKIDELLNRNKNDNNEDREEI